MIQRYHGMSEILTDACFTNVEVTKNIIVNDEVLVDTHRNITGANVIECNTLRYRNLVDISVEDDAQDRSFPNVFSVGGFGTSDSDIIERVQGDQNVHSEEIGALALGGQFNEASGEYAVCLGGRYNEAAGNDGVVLGGRENQSTGDCSAAMGMAAMAIHDRSFVWSSNGEQPAQTTADGQFMVGADALVFKLPDSTSIKTHMIPDKYACWCWDSSRNTLCLKTKQNNTFYKTNMETLVHEIKVNIDDSGVNLVNPDDS
jgi:hypothetical protein